jgi:hypothetical protein
MNEIEIDPIHVATAKETATTTAINIIEAITGLRAFPFCKTISNTVYNRGLFNFKNSL